jgi:hypothetical protein
MRTKRTEAKLLSYSLLYDRSGKLITERLTTDIEKLKPYFTTEEFNTLKTTMQEATVYLDKVHNLIEAHLNARKMTD